MRFRWAVRRDFATGVTVLRLAGELDRDGSGELSRVLDRCRLDEPLALVVDLNGVRFVDTGLFGMLTGVDPANDAIGTNLILSVNAFTPTGRLARAALGDAVALCASLAEAVDLACRPERRIADRLHVHLTPHPLSPQVARQLTESACRSWQLPALLDNARVVMSELVSNAVEHAGTELDVTVTRHRENLRLIVRDRAPQLPRAAPPDPTGFAQRGRGLAVIGALALAWGCEPAEDGKSVWALVGSRLD